MTPTVFRYVSAFGEFEIPFAVRARALRWQTLRPDYLDKWCEFQWLRATYRI